MMTTPCSTATEPLNAALDTVFQSLKQSRLHVAHLIADTEKLRCERDDALKALLASQGEEAARKGEVASCEAALDRAQMKIQHQEETIAQLRRECTQWKDQSRNWQEHFSRVEEERCRLTFCLEELAMKAEEPQPFTTPNSRTRDVAEPSTSSSMTTKRASSSSHASTASLPQQKKHKAGQTPPVLHHSLAPETHSRSRPPTTAHAKSQAMTPSAAALPVVPQLPVVIRRVHAIVEIPVKEEDEDEVAAAGLFTSPRPLTRLRRATPGKPWTHPQKSHPVQFREVGRAAAESEGEYGDEDEELDGAPSLPEYDDEEEDDELRIGKQDRNPYAISARSTSKQWGPVVTPATRAKRRKASRAQ